MQRGYSVVDGLAKEERDWIDKDSHRVGVNEGAVDDAVYLIRTKGRCRRTCYVNVNSAGRLVMRWYTPCLGIL